MGGRTFGGAIDRIPTDIETARTPRQKPIPPGRLRVGCSGWAYADWSGRFYPTGLPRRGWLAFYASRFDAVEVNSTHYGTPSPRTIDEWCAAVPTGFELCVKLHRFGTHRKKLLDAAAWAPRSLEPVRRLGSRAGPMLLQLPPRWRPELGRLDDALRELTRDAARGIAVEVRDPRWLGDDGRGSAIRAVLQRHDAVLCHHDLLPMSPDLDHSAGFAYLRFHGPDPDQPYHGTYPTRRLQRLAERCSDVLAQGHDVHAFFNNDVGGAAPVDATRFVRAVLSVRSARVTR